MEIAGNEPVLDTVLLPNQHQWLCIPIVKPTQAVKICLSVTVFIVIFPFYISCWSLVFT